MNYRCDVCGCYLDPDEGRVCEDCREAADRYAEEHQYIAIRYEGRCRESAVVYA